MARHDNTAELIDQVIAWHHRHPLAQRISVAQVAGLGWVSLPFAAHALAAAPSDSGSADAPPTSLRERALARAQAGAEPDAATAADPFAGPVKPAFSEDLLAPLKPAAIAAFAQACGQPAALAAHQRPRREAAVDRGLVPEGWGLTWLHLRTAAIEVGERRVRVLIAPDGSRILGPRLVSRGRLGLALLLPTVAAAAAAATLWWPRSLEPSQPATLAAAPAASATPAAAATSAASAVPSDSAAAAASSAVVAASAATDAGPRPAAEPVPPQPAVPSPPAPPPASPPLPLSSPSPPSPAPLPQPPAAATLPALQGAAPPATPAELASIRPRLDPEVARAARRESAALRAASEASAASAASAISAPPTPVARPAPAATPATPPAPRAAAPTTAGPVYALVARTTKSRAASEILLGAMTPESGRAPGSPRAEVLAADGGFRASLWPFASRAQAERVRERLRASGLETELVEF